MKTWFAAAALALAPAAWAQDDTVDAVDAVETITAGRHEPLTLPDDWVNPLDHVTPAEFADLPYEVQAYHGADQLGLSPQYVHEVRHGLDLVFERDYKAARAWFVEVDDRFPGTGIGAVVDALVWQALMLENFDYKYDSQYWVSSKRARAELEAALEVPGNEGWEHFLMAGVIGIESIHTMRKEKYLPALQLALDAMAHAGQAREAAPEFVDLLLAEGMYNYWRTVVTQNSKVLPEFGDMRMEGMEQMREVESRGVFLSAPATMALTFSYIEEHKFKTALSACARNARLYPDSVVNNLILGQVQTYMRRYDKALATFDRVIEISPNNQRVRYWRGVTLLRAGRSSQAQVEIELYLASEYLEDHHRAAGHYRMGQVHYRQRRYPEAEDAYKAAVKLSRHSGAKSALDRMKRARREGRIDY